MRYGETVKAIIYHFQEILTMMQTYYENHRTGELRPNFDISDPPTFVTEFSKKFESLNIAELVAA